jgi:L-iditol 2-dehydrogenase
VYAVLTGTSFAAMPTTILTRRGIPFRSLFSRRFLGHEFSGEILELGSEVSDLKRSNRVLCDQGRNCVSQNRWPRCPYCRSGDSRLCDHYGEHGVTGLPGAMADYIAMPAANCLKLPDGMPMELGALVEPLGRVIHASDRVDRSHSRYSFEGEKRISNVLI